MGKKTKDSEPSTDDLLDLHTLQRLQEVGADTEVPRLWEHFLYCDDAAGAEHLAEQATAAGWSVTTDTTDEPYIVASRTGIVNADTIAEARAFFESLATTVPGGDYDGWGAEAD